MCKMKLCGNMSIWVLCSYWNPDTSSYFFFQNSFNVISYLIAIYAFFFFAWIKRKTSVLTQSLQPTFSRSSFRRNTKFLDVQKGDGYNILVLFREKFHINTNPFLWNVYYGKNKINIEAKPKHSTYPESSRGRDQIWHPELLCGGCLGYLHPGGANVLWGL